MLKPASQPHKELIKTSYLPFFNNQLEPGSTANNKHEEGENGILVQSNGNAGQNRTKRPKSGENTAAALKKIYVGTKEKARKLVWNSPGIN